MSFCSTISKLCIDTLSASDEIAKFANSVDPEEAVHNEK